MRTRRDSFKPLLAIAGATLLLALAGCGMDKTPAASSQASRSSPPRPLHAAKEGRFIAIYEPATQADTRREANHWKQNKLLEDFVDTMNGYVRIPRDVKVIGKQCGEANAFYDADTHTIEMCYELAAEERKLFADAGDSAAEIDEELYESAVGTLYHEVGHALLNELELKFTGREEDVADQMAAYVLTADNESKDYLITVADTYALAADQETRLEDLPLYGIHSLNAQRAVNFLCYVYGSDPKAFAYLVKDGSLPEERAEYCETEYAQLADGLEALLEPHLKPTAADNAQAARAAQ